MMKRLWPYWKRTQWYFTAATAAMILGIALDMRNPRLVGGIIDQVIIGGHIHLLQSFLGALAVITVSRAVLGYIKEYLFDFGSQKLIVALQLDLFRHLQTLSFDYFDGVNTGELMSRLKEDADIIRQTFAFGIMLFIEQAIYFCFASLQMAELNWKLAVIAWSLMPLIGIIAFRLEKEIGPVFEELSDQGVILNTTAQENLAGIRLVKAFCREKYEIGKFLKQNQINNRFKIKQAAVWSTHYPRIEFLSNFAIILVITGGGWLVIREELSLGTLVAFSNYLLMLVWPVRMIGWLTNMLAQCRASLQKVEALFAERPSVTEAARPIVPKKIQGEVILEDVVLRYQGAPVLNGINLRIAPGSTVAIMGVTGSGKSSLVHLLPRFYNVAAGRILIDGVDIQDWPLAALRRQIGVVFQDTFLFSDTIAANIRFGAPEASDDQVIIGAKQARIHDFIQELPKKYETVIGERGLGLSGGQKQRLGLARALVAQARILILDDATASLDAQTEWQIQRTLEQLAVTKIIIAHRISAVKAADHILILEDGKVVEAGTHSQLLARRQRYYQTYLNQFDGLPDGDGEVSRHGF